MRLEGAIFDMDGTLLDSMYIWNSIGEEVLHTMGAKPEPDLRKKLKTMDLRQFADYCTHTYGVALSASEIIAMVDDRVDRFYREEVQAKPGVERFLSILKMQGVWMYLATATDRPQVEAALQRTGLDRYFRGILTCQEAGCNKDNPRIFDKCLTRLRCSREQCVVFEDALYAIQTAKKAGYRVAAVYDASSEEDQPEIRKLADYYIRSYDEFVMQDAT
jgi:HAD superfamily hydrolase (TIGR01509 family)